MTQTTLKIDGMMCGMCEAHLCDAVRQHFSVKKVTASHTKGEMVILSPEPLDRAALEKTIADTGYTLVSVTEGAAAEKKDGFLGLFKK